MSDQKLQETWTSFAQTEPGNVVERQSHLDDFLGLLLSSSKEEIPLSNLLHFSDVGSVVSLLGGQFLADIEHICLGSVSYDSDASSSATSRSVESIISDASQVSDGSRGCRPRVTKRPSTGRSHSFKASLSLSQAFQDSDNDKCFSELLPVNLDQAKEQTQRTGGEGLECTKTERLKSSNTVQAETNKQEELESIRIGDGGQCESESLGNETVHTPQDIYNQNSCFKNGESAVDISNESSILKPESTLVSHEADNTATQGIAESSSAVPKSSLHSNANVSSSPIVNDPAPAASTTGTGQDLGQGNEAQNAIFLKHYLLHGCGAKILIALDQLGVA
ncbi:hypothetical protein Hamer_G001063, partial [Homarus americanus]